VKDEVYSHLPCQWTFKSFNDRTVNAITLAHTEFVNKMWDELEYHLNVGRITVGNCPEHVKNCYTLSQISMCLVAINL
jgi:hypothetical protein